MLVAIEGQAFIPQIITVPVGTKVTWINKDQIGHTVTSDAGVFNSPLLDFNVTFSYTFNQPGVFPYHCTPHPFMTARVIVEPATQGVSVTIQDFGFHPQTITVPVGTTVTWTNRDPEEHTVTSDNDVFGSGLLSTNGTFSYTFTEPGVFHYHCIPHPYMTGQVIVE